MYLVNELKGSAARDKLMEPSPSGLGKDGEDVTEVERLEVHGSSYNDPGPDFCEFRAYNSNGELLFTARVRGY